MFPRGDRFPEFDPQSEINFSSCGFIASGVFEGTSLENLYRHLETCADCRYELVGNYYFYQNFHDQFFTYVPEGLSLEEFFKANQLQERHLSEVVEHIGTNLVQRMSRNPHLVVSLLTSTRRLLRFKAEGTQVLVEQEYVHFEKIFRRLLEGYGGEETCLLFGVSGVGEISVDPDVEIGKILSNWYQVLGLTEQ